MVRCAGIEAWTQLWKCGRHWTGIGVGHCCTGRRGGSPRETVWDRRKNKSQDSRDLPIGRRRGQRVQGELGPPKPGDGSFNSRRMRAREGPARRVSSALEWSFCDSRHGAAK